MAKSVLSSREVFNTFPALLLDIWDRKESGCLRIRTGGKEKCLYFEQGVISVGLSSLDGKAFRNRLIQAGLLKDGGVHSAELEATLLTLVEEDILSPSRIWKSMQAFFRSTWLPLFDDNHAEFLFSSGDNPGNSPILFQIPTLLFIQQGLRRMTNEDIFKAALPGDETEIFRLQACHHQEISLEPHENYLLNLIRPAVTLGELFERSHLGKKESRKVIFGLLTLGQVGFREQRPSKTPSESITPLDIQKILAVFNAKCVTLLKHISKEIGPVAWSLLQKSLEEAAPHLPPSLKKLKLSRDGTLITRSFLKDSSLLTSDETRQALLAGLNEVLVAMVLAVKKNLGDEHEHQVVEILDKIGDKT